MQLCICLMLAFAHSLWAFATKCLKTTHLSYFCIFHRCSLYFSSYVQVYVNVFKRISKCLSFIVICNRAVLSCNSADARLCSLSRLCELSTLLKFPTDIFGSHCGYLCLSVHSRGLRVFISKDYSLAKMRIHLNSFCCLVKLRLMLQYWWAAPRDSDLVFANGNNVQVNSHIVRFKNKWSLETDVIAEVRGRARETCWTQRVCL